MSGLADERVWHHAERDKCVANIRAALDERDEWRRRAYDLDAAVEPWRWMDHEENHPESLTCPVMMTADQLRCLLDERDAAVRDQKEQHRICADTYEEHRLVRIERDAAREALEDIAGSDLTTADGLRGHAQDTLDALAGREETSDLEKHGPTGENP